MMNAPYIAHVKPADNGQFEVQTIEEHLCGVSSLMSSFASTLQSASMGEVIGRLHDVGKYRPDFQNYIKYQSGYDTSHPLAKADHKYSGGAYCRAHIANPIIRRIAEICISGHHAGLDDSAELDSKIGAYLPEVSCLPMVPINEPHLPKLAFTPENLHFYIRALFSALVDADYLDTERFMSPATFRFRQHPHNTLKELNERLNDKLNEFKHRQGKTNLIRRGILEQVQANSGLKQGVYTLTVPTGGGKTLCSMSWALRHAIVHDLQRIIVVIPYTSIITQTAKIFREIFGSENILEHHSNVVYSDSNEDNGCSMGSKLLTENWDAPIVVTTNVQFFESLFSNKPSKCRKLHNISNSVILFDEVQMLPLDFLKPVLQSIESLPAIFGSSALMMSATMPALSGKIGDRENGFVGLNQSQELIFNSEELFAQLKRVEFHDIHAITTEELSFRLLQHRKVLCIVNSRKTASQLYEYLHEQTDRTIIHLSRNMCSSHLLAQIEKLYVIEDAIVISTQLIEAGVDIDFPVVYRELAGLDSIAQAGGRCNREGRLTQGNVYIFELNECRSFGAINKGAYATEEVLGTLRGEELLTPQNIKRYFDLFFSKVISNFDKAQVTNRLCSGTNFYFKSVAADFRLINDEGVSVVVCYGAGDELITHLKQGNIRREDFERLQHYSVTLHEKDLEILIQSNQIELVEPYDIWVQIDGGMYDDCQGVKIKNKYMEDILIA